MLRTVLFAVAICSICAGASASPMYTVTDLGSFPAGFSVTGINNSGQVVGWATTNTGLTYGFLYNGGSIQKLGTLTGGTESVAYGINNGGQVVGAADTAGPPTGVYFHAALYSGSQMQDLGFSGTATGINTSGQIVGVSGSDAFLYSGGQMKDLGTLPGYTWGSYAYGINTSGQVVGESATQGGVGGPQHAFLYSGVQMQDLQTLGGTSSCAYGINDAGQIVGYADTAAGVSDAFLYSGGKMQDLGTLGGTSSSAEGINKSGQVVGGFVTAGGSFHAFLYSGGVMSDLNSLIDSSSGWTIQSADAINDSGQIACLGTTGTLGHVLLLTPTPEPATVSLLALGGLALLRRRRHV